ncbi:MAG: hypothetical protein IKS18_08545 [Lachnospiraceae bacterium]|nr:hypothetical protein [Lachnospiraceae bacterium]
MNRNHSKNRIRKAAGVLILQLCLSALLSCEQNMIPTAGTTEQTEIVTSEETTAATEESTEERCSEETTAESAEETVSVVIEPGDTTAAYRTYLEVLQKEKEQIARWNPDAGVSGAGTAENVALCDISGDDAQELLYLVSEQEEGKEVQSAALHILSVSDGTSANLYSWDGLGNPEESRFYCFFTVYGSRMLYAYTGSADAERTDSWYYYETLTDGTLLRRELAVKKPAPAAGEAEYYYMGESCSEGKYRSLTDLLLSGAECILLCSSENVFQECFPDAELFANHYGMSADQAISFLRAELSDLVPASDDFETALWDYLLMEQYLVSGEIYETGEDSAEIVFGLHDMDADGTPELFISNGSPLYAQLTDHIYRFENGNFCYIGDAGFRECLLWTAPGSAYPGVFCTGGHSGFISDIYYGVQADGTVQSEIVATYEDTSYKVETHDAQRLTADQGLYDTWAAMRPAEGREAVYVEMHPLSWIKENGIDAFLQEAGQISE